MITNTMRTIKHGITFALIAACIMNCSTKDEDQREEAVKSSDTGGKSPDDAAKPSTASTSDEPVSPGERRLFVNSMTNNPLTGKTIDRAKAEGEASRLSSTRDYESTLAAQRLAGNSPAQMLGTARKLADVEMRRGIDRDISEEARLELGLAGVQTGKVAAAEYFLTPLIKSKSGRIRAAALNALGVMALREKRIPEAAAAWKEALKAQSGYDPAALNLGMLALEHGDFPTAKSALGAVQQDWFVKSALIVLERFDGNGAAAGESCEKFTQEHPQYKPTLFNCGLFEFQVSRNFAKAKAYLTRMTQARIGGTSQDDKAYRLMGQIDLEAASPGAKPAAAPQSGEKGKH